MSITENADRADRADRAENAENAENASPGGADFDVVIRGGTVFDGTGAPGVRADVGIRAGVVAAISPAPLPVSPGTQVVDAEGRWVTPGFVTPTPTTTSNCSSPRAWANPSGTG